MFGGGVFGGGMSGGGVSGGGVLGGGVVGGVFDTDGPSMRGSSLTTQAESERAIVIMPSNLITGPDCIHVRK